MSDAAAALPFFRVLASEFGPTGPTRKSDDEVLVMLGVVITKALEDFNESASRFNEALAELAAHKFTMVNRIVRSVPGFASTGAVASVGVKGAAFSHTPPSSPSNSFSDDALKQTPHGLEYLGIRDECTPSFGLLC